MRDLKSDELKHVFGGGEGYQRPCHASFSMKGSNCKDDKGERNHKVFVPNSTEGGVC